MTGDLLETARGLDASLRAEARTIATSMVAFRDLITQAKQQQIHAALGFTSWTAYVADVIGTEMTVLAVDDRRQIVALLAADGMSQRAIADAVGVSQKTVDRDLDQLSHDDSVVLPETVTSLDGKQRPAHPKPKPKPKPDVPQPKPQPDVPAPAKPRPVAIIHDFHIFIDTDASMRVVVVFADGHTRSACLTNLPPKLARDVGEVLRADRLDGLLDVLAEPKPQPKPEPPEHLLYAALVITAHCLDFMSDFAHEHEVTDEVREIASGLIAKLQAGLDDIEQVYRPETEPGQS